MSSLTSRATGFGDGQRRSMMQALQAFEADSAQKEPGKRTFSRKA